MPDREGGKYYKGKKLDTTIVDKVRVRPDRMSRRGWLNEWTPHFTFLGFRCHRNNWASFMNSCNLQRRFGPRERDHECKIVWVLTQSSLSLSHLTYKWFPHFHWIDSLLHSRIFQEFRIFDHVMEALFALQTKVMPRHGAGNVWSSGTITKIRLPPPTSIKKEKHMFTWQSDSLSYHVSIRCEHRPTVVITCRV